MSAEHAITHWFDGATLSPLGEGHIHETYEVRSSQGHFVLQQINQTVFTDPELVMSQPQRLLDHWGQQHRFVVPVLVPARDGAVGVRVAGDYWRVWEFVADSRVVDPITRPAQAEAAGAAFGALQRHLVDLPGARFKDPIEGFLQLHHYLRAYDAVAHAAPRHLHALVEAHRSLATRLGQRNALIHGDCKINNLLFEII